MVLVYTVQPRLCKQHNIIESSHTSLLCDCCPCPFVRCISCVPSIGARLSFVEGRVLATLMPANICNKYVQIHTLG